MVGGHNGVTAAEVDTIREQQLKRMQSGEQHAAETDAIGEQQLRWTQLKQLMKRTQSGSSNSVQRTVQHALDWSRRRMRWQ